MIRSYYKKFNLLKINKKMFTTGQFQTIIFKNLSTFEKVREFNSFEHFCEYS